VLSGVICAFTEMLLMNMKLDKNVIVNNNFILFII
jgi:hypothetical protein